MLPRVLRIFLDVGGKPQPTTFMNVLVSWDQREIVMWGSIQKCTHPLAHEKIQSQENPIMWIAELQQTTHAGRWGSSLGFAAERNLEKFFPWFSFLT